MEISQLSSQTTSCHPPLLSLKVIAALLDLVVSSLYVCLFYLMIIILLPGEKRTE